MKDNMRTKMKNNKNRIGKKHSEDTKNKIRSKKKGIKYEKVTCPHCGRIGGSNNMIRFHFDKCKNKDC